MSTKKRWWLVASLVVLAALVGFSAWRLAQRRRQAVAQQRAQAGRAVAVTVAPVEQQDVPQWLEGLGTAVPLSTVVVRSRVDGLLEELTFREGQAVRQGDPLARIDPRPFRIALAQAEATQRRDEAQRRNAQKNLERYQGLWHQRLVPRQQVDDQRALVDQAAAVVGIDRAQVDNARLQLEWSTVTAPADGVAGIRQVDPGNLVHASDPNGLVVLAQLDPISVIFTLPQEQLSRIAAQQGRSPLAVEAWSRDSKGPLARGELAVIDNQVSPTTATLRLKAVVQNREHALWPNQFVKARLLVSVKRGALVVPVEAVMRGAKGSYVYVVGNDSIAQPRDVDVESVEGPLAIIRGGLKVSEQVVIDGQSQLKPGAKVKAQERKKPAEPAPQVGT